MVEFIRYIILIQALLSFFVAGGLFFRDSGLKSATVAFLTLIFGCHMLLFLYGSGGLVDQYPQFVILFYFEVGFLFGPFLYVHLETIFIDKKRLRWMDLLHLLPIVLFWVFFGDILFLPGQERAQYIYDNFWTVTMIWNYTLAGQLFVYAIASILFVLKNKSKVPRNNTLYAILLVSVYGTSSIIIGYLTHYAGSWRDFSIYYLVNGIMVFSVGYILYKDPKFLKQIRKKYFSSNLDKKHMSAIHKKIEVSFKKEELFLQNNLTVKTLGRNLNEKHYHISQTFSEYIKENFNDYVNKHRIEYAKNLLRDPEYAPYKIEAIALESGFNNKVTFYKAFTKFNDDTPSKYRKAYAS